MTGINILKVKVMNTHRELIRNGDFDTAGGILKFLRNGKITLGLGDVGMKVEKILDALGCVLRYAYHHYLVTAYLIPSDN